MVNLNGHHAHFILLVILQVSQPSYGIAGSNTDMLAPEGCPVFHCTPEASGVLHQEAVAKATSVKQNSTLGTLRAQGCSGDGKRLACIVFPETGASSAKLGTLEVLDATTLTPIWGSIASSYDPVASGVSPGQVPLIFADGQIAAGDASMLVRFDPSGAVTGQLGLDGKGANMGITPLIPPYGVVSQADGVLTVVNLATWKKIAVIPLKDLNGGGPLSLVSPSSGAANTLYAVAKDSASQLGILFAVDFDPNTLGIRTRKFVFVGTSGASPVVVKSSPLGVPMVLLHTPSLVGEPSPTQHLLALADDGQNLNVEWMTDLSQKLGVAPTLDEASQSLFYQVDRTPIIRQLSVIDGALIAEFNLQLLGGLPSDFSLNGHLGSIQSGGLFTLLLAGSSKQGRSTQGQYALAFRPLENPGALLWRTKIASTPEQYTAAWNLGVSAKSSRLYCPILVAPGSGVSRICDYRQP